MYACIYLYTRTYQNLTKKSSEEIKALVYGHLTSSSFLIFVQLLLGAESGCSLSDPAARCLQTNTNITQVRRPADTFIPSSQNHKPPHLQCLEITDLNNVEKSMQKCDG